MSDCVLKYHIYQKRACESSKIYRQDAVKENSDDMSDQEQNAKSSSFQPTSDQETSQNIFKAL